MGLPGRDFDKWRGKPQKRRDGTQYFFFCGLQQVRKAAKHRPTVYPTVYPTVSFGQHRFPKAQESSQAGHPSGAHAG